jgi:hypothetical protein
MFCATASIEDRYQAVRNLIYQGATEGERNAARLAAKRMESARPFLRSGPPLESVVEDYGFEQDFRSPTSQRPTYTCKIGDWTIVAQISAKAWFWTVRIYPHIPGYFGDDGYFGVDLHKALQKSKHFVMRYHENLSKR